MIQAVDIRRAYLLILAIGVGIAAIAAGCSSEPGPILCIDHDDCGPNQICRSNYCLDVFDPGNLCELDSECPADSVCLTGACMPNGVDGDEDGDIGIDGDSSDNVDGNEEETEGDPEPEYNVNCDDGNECTYDIYDGATCIHQNANEGLPCDDHNTVTENDRCQQGLCRGDAADPDQCCGLACEDCTHLAISHGSYSCIADACEVVCDSGYRLTAGVCAPFSCDDGNPCTLDQLNSDTGACDHIPLGNDIPCSVEDGQCGYRGVCVEDTCSNLALRTDCDDGVDCTDDDCDPDTGCASTPNDDNCDSGQQCDAVQGCITAE